jgi:hypothetical protein
MRNHLKTKVVLTFLVLVLVGILAKPATDVFANWQAPPPTTPVTKKENAVVAIVSPEDKAFVNRKETLPVKVHFNTTKIKAQTPSNDEKTYYLQPIQAVELLLNGKSYEVKQLKKPLKEGDVTFSLSFTSLPQNALEAHLQAKIYTVYVPAKPPQFKGTKKLGAESQPITIILEETIQQTAKQFMKLDQTSDTDGDGLRNGFELINLQLATYPDKVDTDGDHVNDGQEDTDADGLINIEEQNKGTDPLLTDTDADGLSDGDEVSRYLTNPLKPDTDGDGLDDGLEVELGTNPLLADTNNDGITDGNTPLQ